MDKDTYDTGIFGVYNLQDELINDRKYYKKDDDNKRKKTHLWIQFRGQKTLILYLEVLLLMFRGNEK